MRIQILLILLFPLLLSYRFAHSEEKAYPTLFSVCFSPDGKYLLTAGDKSIVKVWNIKEQKQERSFSLYSSPFDYTITSMVFNPDGKKLALSCGAKAVLVDFESGKKIREFDGHDFSEVKAVGYSPDGKYIVTGSTDQTAKIWDAETGKELKKLKGHDNSISAMVITSDSKYLFTGDEGNIAIKWDLQTGKKIKVFKVVGDKYDDIYSMALSPDGKILAIGGQAKPSFWNHETGEMIIQFQKQWGVVYSVAFTPDGLMFLAGNSDNIIDVLEIESSQMAFKLEGHSKRVIQLQFSKDGNYLLSGSADDTAKIWDLKEGKLLSTFTH